MSIYGISRRVVCYVTRSTQRGTELLVFEHADDDPGHPSGVQVPAGGMLPAESLPDAAAREVAEETGLSGLTYVDQVGFTERSLTDPGGAGVDNYVHLQATASSHTSDAVDGWEHRVTGEGDDAGLTFCCRWEPLPLRIPLADHQAAFLDRVAT